MVARRRRRTRRARWPRAGRRTRGYVGRRRIYRRVARRYGRGRYRYRRRIFNNFRKSTWRWAVGPYNLRNLDRYRFPVRATATFRIVDRMLVNVSASNFSIGQKFLPLPQDPYSTFSGLTGTLSTTRTYDNADLLSVSNAQYYRYYKPIWLKTVVNIEVPLVHSPNMVIVQFDRVNSGTISAQLNTGICPTPTETQNTLASSYVKRRLLRYCHGGSKMTMKIFTRLSYSDKNPITKDELVGVSPNIIQGWFDASSDLGACETQRDFTYHFIRISADPSSVGPWDGVNLVPLIVSVTNEVKCKLMKPERFFDPVNQTT